MNAIINMIIRQVMRRLVNKGIDAGFNQASRMGNCKKRQDGEVDPRPMPESKADKRRARQSAQRAKQSMKVLRRIGRF